LLVLNPLVLSLVLARARELGLHLEAVWQSSTTTARDRKRLLRTIVDEVQLTTDDQHHHVCILWKGGTVTDRDIVRFRSGGDAAKASATADEIIEYVRKLAREFDDAQIARILNRQGHRSGRGLAFTQSSVTSLRSKNHIPKCPAPVPRDEREGPFTADEAARELGVSMHTVHRWLRDGILVGQQATPRAPWRILLTEDVRRRLAGGAAPPDWVGLDEAARRLGMPKSTVAHLVKQGKLPAMRTTVGKRECWRIDLSSASCGRQRDLFYSMINADTKDP